MKHVGLRSNAKDIASQEQLDFDFTIIYPNGGSAGSPASVSVNSRYVVDHPFPGFHVICVAEVFIDGNWTNTGWLYSDAVGAAGVTAGQYNGAIIVQTGNARLMSGSSTAGDLRGVNGVAVTTPLPCRVLIWKVKGAIA